MKKTLVVLAVCTLLSASVFADVITYDSQEGLLNTRTTLVAGATVYDFETPATSPTFTSPNGKIVQGDGPGLNAAPANPVTGLDDLSWYFTVPENLANSPLSSTITFGASYNYLGLHWGSIDSYNTIAFYDGISLVGSYTGSDITSPNAANGDQASPDTNTYVNFFMSSQFDSIVVTSTQYAFEFDNLAVANVPVPGAVLLGMLGLVAAGRKLRKMC